MTLQILSDHLHGQFKNEFSTRLDDVIDSRDKIETPVDHFFVFTMLFPLFTPQRLKVRKSTLTVILSISF